ncbi:protocatechuate dioxygenase [Rhodococcus sp. SGAir0479]|uniref:protocatechuate dioxygenase n=1 Tax=Rhodococcus sp. SGAir0479 TaxID=2567884 RepID=UPI0010CCB6C3|nr:protocatechuate dioxygenase [Rhodococcus sp. SGAir0479]QCQ92708.1 protocatechuate dioxygenase [Rhodococcus sp. SGAir0479]
MDRDVELSRLRISRRRALALGGAVSLGGLLAACGGDPGTAPTATGTTTAVPSDIDPRLLALLDEAPHCVMAVEETQGPYWFDVDSIRRDIREDRPGLQLDLALRVQHARACAPDGGAPAVANAVVEIWHCDAGGVYSGYEAASRAASGDTTAPAGGAPAGGVPSVVTMSDGSYSLDDGQFPPTDDGTYLRGAQTTDANGIAQFTTIFPGWYTGRTVHIHVKVHIDRRTVLTSQLYVDDALSDDVFATVAPYPGHPGRDTRNDTDVVFHDTGLVAAVRDPDRILAAINLGLGV